jgi:hypothetical protein
MLVVLCYGYVEGDNDPPPAGDAAGVSVPADAEAAGAFCAADAERLVKHLVLAHYYRTHAAQCVLQLDLDGMWARCEWVSAHVQPALACHIEASPRRELLSSAARALFEQLPAGLAWEANAGGYGCYVAEGGAGGLGGAAVYSVSTVTGCALRNGAAPSRLPAAVVQHATYQQLFDGLEFEVTDDFATRQPIQGRVYRVVRDGEALGVWETEGSGDDAEVLELLPGAALAQLEGNFRHCSGCHLSILPSCLLHHNQAACAADVHVL